MVNVKIKFYLSISSNPSGTRPLSSSWHMSTNLTRMFRIKISQNVLNGNFTSQPTNHNVSNLSSFYSSPFIFCLLIAMARFRSILCPVLNTLLILLSICHLLVLLPRWCHPHTETFFRFTDVAWKYNFMFSSVLWW